MTSRGPRLRLGKKSLLQVRTGGGLLLSENDVAAGPGLVVVSMGDPTVDAEIHANPGSSLVEFGAPTVELETHADAVVENLTFGAPQMGLEIYASPE